MSALGSDLSMVTTPSHQIISPNGSGTRGHWKDRLAKVEDLQADTERVTGASFCKAASPE